MRVTRSELDIEIRFPHSTGSQNSGYTNRWVCVVDASKRTQDGTRTRDLGKLVSEVIKEVDRALTTELPKRALGATKTTSNTRV